MTGSDGPPCGFCDDPVPASSPSSDFCGELCQSGWQTGRVPRSSTPPVLSPHRVGGDDSDAFLPAVRWCLLCGERGPAAGERWRGNCARCRATLPPATYVIRVEPGRERYVMTFTCFGQARRAATSWDPSLAEAAMLFEALEENFTRGLRTHSGDKFSLWARVRAEAGLSTGGLDPRALLGVTGV